MEPIHSNIRWFVLMLCLQIKTIISQEHILNHDSLGRMHQRDSNLLTKVQLTQKGYIQFLRYIEDVPTMTEYTFCIWMNSHNLTYSHPLLSYSRNEEEKLLRVWISPTGTSINLEIHGNQVFNVPMKFKEHQWYHICQSWSSATATWELFVSGKKKLQGHAPKLTGLRIKSGGDIVVGQEYTDFDKGLEDGIEGSIFGFNFVLSATSPDHKYPRYIKTVTSISPRSYTAPKTSPLIYLTVRNPPLESEDKIMIPALIKINGTLYTTQRKKKSNSIQLRPAPGEIILHDNYEYSVRAPRKAKTKSSTLGMRLVELSKNCRVGKGGPLQGKKVLINWTKTTVRVFGGAIMKHVEPFC